MTQNQTKAAFQVGRYQISIADSFPLGALCLWMIINLVMIVTTAAPYGKILVFGAGAALLHFGVETLHNVGHALAAKWVGHPMQGIRIKALLVQSIYPDDEPTLPGAIHIKRALGGPAFSALLTLLMWLLLQQIPYANEIWQWWLRFFFWDSLLIATIGALVPLPFTDGGTVLQYWRTKSTQSDA